MSDPHVRRFAIRGYRSIVRADLRLGQITVVIGPSDSGKSNLVRAFRDWAFNAAGASFVTKGLDVTRVAAAVGHDVKVVWEKLSFEDGKATARYVLADASKGTTQSFEKIGRDVPGEIAGVTGIREVAIDDLKIRPNLAEQAEPWFLVSPTSWTPARVSRVVGKVSGVDSLVLANRDLNNLRMVSNREAKAAREREAAATETLKQFDGLDELAAKVDRLEALERSVTVGRKTVDAAVALVRRVREARTSREALRGRLDALRAVKEAADRLDLAKRVATLSQAKDLLHAVSGIADRRKAAQATMKAARDRLRSLATELKSAAGVCPVCSEVHPECAKNLADRATRSAK